MAPPHLYTDDWHLVVDGQRSPSFCFSYEGHENADAHQSTSALVGFRTDRAPAGVEALQIAQFGEHFQVPLEAT